MINESTTLNTKYTLIIYILSHFDSEAPIVTFLDFIKQDVQDTETIEHVLWLNTESVGISKLFVLKNWIVFASDGTSVIKEVLKTETDDVRGED